VVDLLERDGAGLNLTAEVRDGIFKHSKGKRGLLGADPETMATTLEGRIVRLADIIAYVNHDLDDAVRAGLVRSEQIPTDLVGILGPDHEQRVLTMMRDMIEASRVADGGDILLSAPVAGAVMALRDWLYQHVYRVPRVQVEFEKASRILRELFQYFTAHSDTLTRLGGYRRQGDSLEVAVADFLAGLTDRYAMNLYQRQFLPQPWKIL
jgi:dGTPase